MLLFHRALVIVFTVAITSGQYARAEKASDKYSKKANVLPDSEIYDPDFRNIQRPFRMAKLNLVWTKAQQVGNWCSRRAATLITDRIVASLPIPCSG